MVKVLKDLQGMRDRWQMYAVTREAFVAIAGLRIGDDGFKKLSEKCLSISGTEGVGVDTESCRTLLDEAFANKVINEALLIHVGQQKPKSVVRDTKLQSDWFWYICPVHGDNSGCNEEGTLCGSWSKIIRPNEGYCSSCGNTLLYASDTKAWYCSEGCDVE